MDIRRSAFINAWEQPPLQKSIVHASGHALRHNSNFRRHLRTMSIQFLCRPAGAKITLASLIFEALVFCLILQIDRMEIADILYLTIVFAAAMTLVISVTLIGTLRILRGETTLKRILIYLGCGVGVVPIWVLIPTPVIVLLPFCFFALIYGIGGYIGFCIQRRRRHVA